MNWWRADCEKAEQWLKYGSGDGSVGGTAAPPAARPGGFPGFSTAGLFPPSSAQQPTPTRDLFGSAAPSGGRYARADGPASAAFGASPAFGLQAAYGEQTVYGQQAAYGEQTAYGQQATPPYGLQGQGPAAAFGQATPYAQQQATPAAQAGGRAGATAGAAALSAMSLQPPASAHGFDVRMKRLSYVACSSTDVMCCTPAASTPQDILQATLSKLQSSTQ